MITPEHHPPIIAFIYCLIAIVIDYFIPLPQIRNPGLTYIGGALILFGSLSLFWAWALFKKLKTGICPIDKPTSFIPFGPYRFSRNPMYLSMIVILVGLSFLLGKWVMLGVPIAFFITIRRVFIPFEEARLEMIFGDQYLDYTASVRRWL